MPADRRPWSRPGRHADDGRGRKTAVGKRLAHTESAATALQMAQQALLERLDSVADGDFPRP